jgi:hypothetical protein
MTDTASSASFAAPAVNGSSDAAGTNGANHAHERAPRLVPGAVLGELDASTTRQMYLLSLPDGRNFQLAGPLYHLATLLDGERTHAEVAAALSERIGRPVSADEVYTIVETKLGPLGILAPAGKLSEGPAPFGGFGFGFGGGFGGAPWGGAPPMPDAPLGIVGRVSLVPARVLEPLAEAVKHLFNPLLAVPVLTLIVLAHVYTYQQLLPRLAEFNPFAIPLAVLLLGPLAVQAVTPWHELGHAAAARSFGARHGPLGVGLMGLTVVAFVEVTDIWRLPRRQRLVVDLGGLYFQSMSVIVLAAWALVSGDPTPLWVVLVMDMAMLMNVNPLFKLDGYWAVSDATGIINLHQRVGEQLRTAVARVVLAGARLLHIGPLAESTRLRQAAAGTAALSAYAGGARVALVLYSVLFVITAVYFLLMFVLIVPVLVISYPLLVGLAVMAVTGLIAGTADPAMSVGIILQFLFVTLMLVALVGMLVPVVLMATGRRPRPPGWRG